jgi:toxin-antitoxin system PIN domain toxin
VFVVDTNVLVGAAIETSPIHAPCRRRVESWADGDMPWFITWSVAYEFVRVVTHPRVLAAPISTSDAWRYLRRLIASPSADILTHTERHAEIAGEVWAALPEFRGNRVHDLHIAILMREHGIDKIYTRDRGFQRFPFLRALDPLDSES